MAGSTERRIKVTLESNAPGFARDMDKGAQSVKSFGEAAAKTEKGTKAAGDSTGYFRGVAQEAIGTMAGFVSAQAIMNGVKGAFDFAKDTILGFDDAMTQSVAIMGNVSDSMKTSLGDTARKVAVDYNESVSNVAQGYYFLISAGYDVASSQKAIGVTTAFAKAGMFDLERATELAADAQNAMGLKSNNANENLKQLTRITDVLTKANIDANGSVEQFATALTNKAAAASRLAGISLEDTVGVLEAFAAQGLKGKRAGEAYAIVLRDLQQKALINKDAFQALGVQVFDSQGKFAGWSSVVRDVERATAGMSTEQKTATLATLGFTAEGSDYLKTLIGMSSEIDRYTAGVKDAGGATQQVAQNQMQSMAEKLKHLKSLAAELVLEGFDKVKEAGNWLGDKFGPSFDLAVKLVGMLLADLRPLAELMGKAFGAVVVGSLMALAGALETVLGFVTENRVVMDALVALITAKAIVAVATLAGEYIGLGAAMAVATGQRVLSAWFVMVDAAGGVGAAVKTMGANLMGLTGGPTGALLAVAAAIFLVKNGFDTANTSIEQLISKTTSRMDTSSIESLHAAMTQIKTDTDAVRDAFADQGFMQQWGSTLAQMFGKDLGTSAQDYIAATNQGREATEKLAKSSFEAKSRIDFLARSYSPLTAGLNEANEAAKKQSASFLISSEMSDKIAANNRAASTQVQNITNELARLAEAKGLDLSKPVEEWSGALEEAYTQSHLATAGQLEFYGALETVGDTASTAKDRLDAYKQSMDAVIGVHISSYDAATKFAGSLQAMTDAITKNGQSFDLATEKGRANRDALSEVAKASMDHAVAVAQETGQISDGNAVLAIHRQQLLTVMTQMLGNRDAAEKYINQLGLTPENLLTLMQLNGVPQATAGIQQVQGGLDHVAQGADGTININVQGALNAIQSVKNELASVSLMRNIDMTSTADARAFDPSNPSNRRAAGGPAYSGEQYLVGEYGPEILDMRHGRAYITSKGRSEAAMPSITAQGNHGTATFAPQIRVSLSGMSIGTPDAIQAAIKTGAAEATEAAFNKFRRLVRK